MVKASETLTCDSCRLPIVDVESAMLFWRSAGLGCRVSELRLAHNVLLLEHGRLLVRRAGAFDRERAIEIGRALR